MIRVFESKFDLTNYNSLKEKLFLEISKNITMENIDSIKLILKDNSSKCVYCIVKDIITYNDTIEYIDDYKVNAYIDLAYYYTEALKAKGNLTLRNQYLTVFKGYIDSNIDAQTFMPNYAILNDFESLRDKISNKNLYVSFINEILYKSYLDFNDVCRNIFDYEKYIDTFRNRIVETTNIKVCPYCNQEQIHEVIDSQSGEKRMIGDLDHFYLQSKMPLLGLTFSNFIPSCMICNRALKHQSLEKILNPRKRGFDSDAKFVLRNIIALKTNKVEDIEIKLEISDSSVVCNEIKASKNLFKIDQLYNHISNKEEIKRLYNSTAIMSEGGAKIWKKMFGVETFEEVYERLIGFNIDIDTTEFINIRHGKLISDIFGKEYFS